jgi:hypothetical protein
MKTQIEITNIYLERTCGTPGDFGTRLMEHEEQTFMSNNPMAS